MSRRIDIVRIVRAAVVIAQGGAALALPARVAGQDWSGAEVTSATIARLTRHEPFSPYRDTVVEWKMRGSSPLLSTSRTWVDGFGTVSSLVLVLPADFAGALHMLADCPWEPGRDDPRPDYASAEAWAWVELESEAGASRVAATTPADLDALNGCIEAFAASAFELAPVEPVANPYWIAGEHGMLRTETDVPAELWVDGAPTFLVTPIHGLPLEPGVHALRWISTLDGRTREETVTIERDTTTTLNVVIE